MKGIMATFITSVLAYPIHSLNFLQHHSYVSIVCYSYSPAMKETGSEFQK